jgi:hypothetical protein
MTPLRAEDGGYLSGFEISVLELNLLVGWRAPDKVGAMSVYIHAIPQRHSKRIFHDDSLGIQRSFSRFFTSKVCCSRSMISSSFGLL